MPLDLGRVTHLLEQMHRSEDDSGNPIVIDKVLVTDGARGFTWEDYGVPGLTDIVTGLQAHGNLGATETFSADIGTHTGTLNADCTFTLTDFQAGESRAMALWLTQDGTGGWTITLPAEIVNAADLEASQDTTADSTSILVLWSVDGGTNIIGAWWGGGGSALTVENEGTPLATDADTLDFVGPLVTASGTGATKTITVTGALDDLTDVTITSPASSDRLRYNGSAWVNSALVWVPVMVEDGATGLWYVAVTGDGDAVMTEV